MTLIPLNYGAKSADWDAWMKACGGTLQGYLKNYKGTYPRHQIISIFTADLRAKRAARQ